MNISSKQIALLHVAKARLGLSEDQYRDVLVQIGGVTSSTGLDQNGFSAVMGFLEWRGFTPLVPHGRNYGDRPGMATFAQIELVRDLWREYTRGGGEETLNKWLERCFTVSSLRFLKKDTAPKVITALKAMKARARAA